MRTSKPRRIVTTRQARSLREGIEWGRVLNTLRGHDTMLRRRVADLIVQTARRDERRTAALIRTTYPWTKGR